MSENNQRFEWVDALRGWAILAVIMVHVSSFGVEAIPQFLVDIMNNGTKGVQLFFVCSAFTLYYTYQKHSRQEKYYLGNFFLRRFFRIAPLYYIAIILYVVLDNLQPLNWFGNTEPISIWNIVSNFLFVHGINPYWINYLVPGGWSISVEMTFYLLIPLLFKHVNSKSRALLFAIIGIILSQAFNQSLLHFPLISNDRLWELYLYMYLPAQISVFTFGILLYYFVFPQYETKNVNDQRILRAAILLGAALLLFFGIYGKGLPSQFVFGFAFMAVAYICSQMKIKLLENKFTIIIGKYSYTLYITHFISLYFLDKLNFLNFIKVDTFMEGLVNYALRYIVVFTVSMIMSIILYHLIEQPMIKFGRKVIKKRETSKISMAA